MRRARTARQTERGHSMKRFSVLAAKTAMGLSRPGNPASRPAAASSARSSAKSPIAAPHRGAPPGGENTPARVTREDTLFADKNPCDCDTHTCSTVSSARPPYRRGDFGC